MYVHTSIWQFEISYNCIRSPSSTFNVVSGFAVEDVPLLALGATFKSMASLAEVDMFAGGRPPSMRLPILLAI